MSRVTLRRLMAGLVAVLVTAATLAAAEKKEKPAEKPKADVYINIVGPGTAAPYIKEGETTQKPVTVTVGQSVVWHCDDKTDHNHTATSTKMVDGKPLFNTGQITKGGGYSAPIIFDEALFKKAGGVDGGEVTLDYVCANHPRTMGSKIILKSVNKKKD